MIETLDKAQGIQMPKLTMKQRQEKLFRKLDLSGLESSPLELADSAWSPLAVLIQPNRGLKLPMMIQADPSAIGGRSLYTLARDVEFRHNSPQPEC